MTEPYWNQIPSLGDRRAAVLAESLGIRSLETLAATGVDEIADALASAGKGVPADTVKQWQGAARKILKAEPVDPWIGMIGSAEVAQGGSHGEVIQPLAAGALRPLEEGLAFWIRMEDAEPLERVVLRPIGSGQSVMCVPRHEAGSRHQRWLVGGAQRGLYRIEATVGGQRHVRGPVVQVI